MKSHVARTFGDDDTEYVGEVVGTKRDASKKKLKSVSVTWAHVPGGFAKTEDLSPPQLAAALALAADLGVEAVVPDV